MYSSPSNETKAARPRTRGFFLLALAAVALVELVSLYLLFGMRVHQGGTGKIDASQIVKYAYYFSLFALLAFALVSWPKRKELYEKWSAAAAGRNWRQWLGANVAVFAAMLPATLGFAIFPTSGVLKQALFASLCGGGALMLLALLLSAAPLAFWRRTAASHRFEILLALGGAAFVSLFAIVSQQSWSILAAATINLTAGILHFYEMDVHVDAAQRILGVGDYGVIIDPACSGYEGIGLVVGFVGLYLAAFRKQLRFPNALLLLPIGIVVIWLLNAVRLAALISIGAHWSPEIASHSFHSQAGWIVFLAVAISIMFIAHGSSFFRQAAWRPTQNSDPNLQVAIAFILPLAAVMAAHILASAFSTGSHWLYVFEVAAAALVFWLFRKIYLRLIERVSVISVAAGLIVGVAWIATDPALGHPSALDAWVGKLAPVTAAGWIGLRIIGSVIVTPVVEELAFRGYLHRALISRRFEAAAPGQFSLLAFVVTTILFGAMHSRWLSAGLAGAVYASTLYRTNRIADPIAAHMASNVVVAGWAIAVQQYALL